MNVSISALDGMGSILYTNANGVLHDFAYSPFGSKSAGGDGGSLLPGFNGERLDPVGETYQLGNGYRTYNPILMRFNAPDSWSPFGNGGLNQYAYCEGDPINRSDPSGHMGSGAATGLRIGLEILGLMGAVVTFGQSIAATVAAEALTGAMMADLIATGSGVVSSLAQIASTATREADPEASQALGWVAFGLGIATVVTHAGTSIESKTKNSSGFRGISRSDHHSEDPWLARRQGAAMASESTRPIAGERRAKIRYLNDSSFAEHIAGGAYHPIVNLQGANIWLTDCEVEGPDVLSILGQAERQNRKVTLLSGSHGNISGIRTRSDDFAAGFVADFKHCWKPGAVDVLNINCLTREQITRFLQGTGDVVVAFCFSRNDSQIREILDLHEVSYYAHYDGPYAPKRYS